MAKSVQHIYAEFQRMGALPLRKAPNKLWKPSKKCKKQLPKSRFVKRRKPQ